MFEIEVVNRKLRVIELNRSLLTLSSSSSSTFSFGRSSLLLLSLLSSLRSLLLSFFLNLFCLLLLFSLSGFSFSFLAISFGFTLVISCVFFGDLSGFDFNILVDFSVEFFAKSSLDHF